MFCYSKRKSCVNAKTFKKAQLIKSQFKMSDQILDVQKLHSNFNESVIDEASASKNVSESSIESDYRSSKNVSGNQKRHYSSSISNNNTILVEEIDENDEDSDWDESDDEPSPRKDLPLPNIASVNIQNAENTMFGNRTVYNGPVTIKQFVNASEDDGNVEESMKSASNTDNNREYVIKIDGKSKKEKGKSMNWIVIKSVFLLDLHSNTFK